ncbi:SusC/RagA family TonB-linked outer membrane protein [Chitinophaga lutea]
MKEILPGKKVSIMRMLLLFCWVFFLTAAAYAQSGGGADAPVLVRGKILDVKGVPLPGVTIQVVGTSNGVVTDPSGSYAISTRRGDVLKYSFMGYKPQEIKVENKTTIDVVLAENLTSLDEIQVVGMGVQRKASVIGAISSVPIAEVKIPTRSLTNALAGRMAGAVVVQRTGELGRDNGGLWIRGISTFSANRSPLILVDGVERDMNDLNMEEVESVSILKDASATAVYGVRAANGVVLVTTRKGIAQKPVIELKLEYGQSDLPKLPKFLSGPDYAMLYNEAFGRENYSQEYINNMKSGTDPYLFPNVNWFDETYKKYSNNGQATLTVRGGGEVARYFVAFGYMNEAGNLKNNPNAEYKSNLGLQRYNFRSNVDVSLSKSTVVNLEVGGSLTDLHTPGTGGTIYSSTFTPAGELFYWSYLATPISNPVRIPIGKDGAGNDIWGWGAPTQVGEKNPVERLMGSGFNTEFRNQFMSQITLNQDLKQYIPGLEFKFSYSFDAYNETVISRRKNSSSYGVRGRDPQTGALQFIEVERGQDFLGYSRDLGSNRAKEMKAQFVYSKKMGRHNIGSMLMYYQRDYINGSAGSAILSLPYRRQGVAFRATYDYNDRYFAEFNLGYNGSENFPKGKRFGYFPAFAGGWIVSNERFWDNYKSVVDLLKIKGSIGLVGSEALPGGSRYGYLSIYGAGLGGYPFGETPTSYTGTGEDRVGVTNLTWEKGLKRNIGFELNMFGGVISLEADYFHEKRTDILLQRASLPNIAGINTAPFANMGQMVNRGVDGTMEVRQKFNKGNVRVYGNFTYARDKILAQDEAPKNFDYRMRTGHKYGQNFGMIALGYFESEEDIKNSPRQTFGAVRPGDVKFADVNGDGVVDVNDEVPIGYSNLPEINYGFGFQVDYRRFDLGMFFRGQGRVSYALGGAYVPFNQGVGKGNIFADALDRWTVDNPRQDALFPRIANGRSANNWTTSTKTLYNGRFLRLADIELGYNLNPRMLARARIKDMRIYVVGSNMAVFAPWTMWDPESGTADGGNYPPQRKVNFGIRTKF